jgi:hypothetical protein
VSTRHFLLLSALFALSLPLVTPRIYASDEIEYFAHLRSAWFDRDLSFENEYQYFYERGIAKTPDFHETFLERRSATGRRINFAPVGCAILWAPFYAVGDLTARALRAAGQPVEVDGYSMPYVRAVAYGSAFYGFASLLFALAAVGRALHRRLTPADDAAAVAVWWGTPLAFYMYLAPPMSHATSAFVVALFVFTWIRVRERWSVGGFAALGALTALLAMVREQDVFFAVGPALDVAWTRATAGERIPWPRLALGLVAAGACFGLVFVPQALAYLALNGRIGPSELVARKMSWSAPHALQVLASPEHGFLVWTPLAVIGLAGLAGMLVRPEPAGTGRGHAAGVRVVAACLLAMIAAQVYVAGSVESWTVAGAFGQRRFVGLTPILVIGLAALFASSSGRIARRAAIALTAIAVWWNVGLMIQFGSGLMDRQRIELGRITYNNFVAVPRRVPELAYRYLFARSTFYKPPAAPPDPGR